MKPVNCFKKSCLAITLFALSAVPSFAQGRAYIKERIRMEGACRNVAITKTNGDLMLHGQTGYARSGCPASLNTAIADLTNKDIFIDDVQLTEKGRWLILFGNNGVMWEDIPPGLATRLKEFHKQYEIITSATFNDIGDWIVITQNHFVASRGDITQWLENGNKKYGHLLGACVTDDAMVAVYTGGYQFLGNVPTSLKDALRNTSLRVSRLKIAGSSWFFADKDGNYQYNM